MYSVAKKIQTQVAGVCFLALTTFSTIASDAKLELQKHLEKFDGYQAKFTQVVKDSEGQTIHESLGNLLFKQPGMFEWQVTEPESELLISDGATVWWFNPFVEQVTIYDANQAMDKTPFALLVSKDEQVWQQFEIMKTKSGYAIVPKQLETAQVIKLDLTISAEQLEKITITTRSRQISEYSLFDQTLVEADKSRFEFKIPDGVDIDDQRVKAPVVDGNVTY